MIGDESSPPKRIRIDVLEDLVRQLRQTVAVVARDLGVSDDDVNAVELVDLEAGSCGTVWEQTAQRPDALLPLAFALDEVAARSKGRPHRSILTDASRQSISDLTALFASYGARGIPIRVEDLSPEHEGLSGPYAAQEHLVLVPSASLPTVESRTDASQLPEAEERSDVRGEWLLRFTGDVQRIDRERKIWLRVNNVVKKIKPKLTEELFAAVDADDARWKRVEITAVASGTSLDDVADILRIAPSQNEDGALEATPINETASEIQPVLDRMEELSKLGDRWDSYEGKAIARSAIEQAKKFLILAAAEARSRRKHLILPFVAPVSHGSVQMEWERERRVERGPFLALEFDGKQIAYIREAGDTTVEGVASCSQAIDFVTWFHELGERPDSGDAR